MADESAEIDPDVLFAQMPEGNGALNEKMGVELVSITPDRIVATMPVEGNTQPYGLLHGGASAVLAETLGSIGSALSAPPGRVAVGVDINVTHHRGLRAGSVVTGVATPAHRGKASATFEVIISDEADNRVATARLTCALIPSEKLR